MDLKEVLKNNSDKEVIYMIGFGFKNYNNSDEPLGFLDGLKIGYSNNLSHRLVIYQRGLLDFNLLGMRDGNLVLESAIHTWYSEYRFKIRRLVEWFKDYDYIRDTFEIIPDEVFLRFSKNQYNPRGINNLYRFGLKYLMKDPNNDFEQEMLWRLSAGSNISIESSFDISEDLIRDIYYFSKKYLKLSLKPIENILENLEEIKSSFETIEQCLDKELVLKQEEILNLPLFQDRIRLCCEYYSQDPNHPVFNYLPKDYKDYIEALGVDGIISNSSDHSKIEKTIKDLETIDKNKETILNELKFYYSIGDRVSLKDLKSVFKEIKNKYNLPFAAKGSLIKNYCSVSDTMLTDKETGKRLQGYKILSFLDQ